MRDEVPRADRADRHAPPIAIDFARLRSTAFSDDKTETLAHPRNDGENHAAALRHSRRLSERRAHLCRLVEGRERSRDHGVQRPPRSDRQGDRGVGGFPIICAMRERTRFPRAVIEALPNLKLLITTGMRNASIDLEAAKARGVVVCGTPRVRQRHRRHRHRPDARTARHIGYENARLKAGAAVADHHRARSRRHDARRCSASAGSAPAWPQIGQRLRA